MLQSAGRGDERISWGQIGRDRGEARWGQCHGWDSSFHQYLALDLSYSAGQGAPEVSEVERGVRGQTK